MVGVVESVSTNGAQDRARRPDTGDDLLGAGAGDRFGGAGSVERYGVGNGDLIRRYTQILPGTFTGWKACVTFPVKSAESAERMGKERPRRLKPELQARAVRSSAFRRFVWSSGFSRRGRDGFHPQPPPLRGAKRQTPNAKLQTPNVGCCRFAGEFPGVPFIRISDFYPSSSSFFFFFVFFSFSTGSSRKSCRITLPMSGAATVPPCTSSLFL